jgi:hypothetical protein
VDAYTVSQDSVCIMSAWTLFGILRPICSRVSAGHPGGDPLGHRIAGAFGMECLSGCIRLLGQSRRTRYQLVHLKPRDAEDSP